VATATPLAFAVCKSSGVHGPGRLEQEQKHYLYLFTYLYVLLYLYLYVLCFLPQGLTFHLTYTILSAMLGMFQFGYNTGVINAPEKVSTIIFSLGKVSTTFAPRKNENYNNCPRKK
jgi:hypothetical protein